MKTSEIRALLERVRGCTVRGEQITVTATAVLLDAIETLLAREAEVLRINDDMQLFARVKRNQIANILNPEGE